MKLVIILLAITLTGCEEAPRPCASINPLMPQKLDLEREKKDAEFELRLRQSELAEMMQVMHKPGVVGVSSAWLSRKNDLQEKILQARLRAHDLDLKIASLP